MSARQSGEMSALWTVRGSGAQSILAAAGRHPDRGPVGAVAVTDPTVLLRQPRLPGADVRRAAHHASHPAGPAHQRPAWHVAAGRAGPGRTGRGEAGPSVGHADQPRQLVAAAARATRPGPRRAHDAGRGRLRTTPRPRLRHRRDRHAHASTGRSASRPRDRDAGRLVHRPSRGGSRVSGPSRRLCRGHPTGRTTGGAGRRPLASVAQPRGSCGEDRQRPPSTAHRC
jgi:hypothetical protein